VARLVDANVLILFYTGANSPIPENRRKAQDAANLLARVERGDETIVLTTTILYEVIFLLQRAFRIPRPDIRQRMVDLLSKRNVRLVNKRRMREALDIYATTGLSIVDALTVAEMRAAKVNELYSWDTDFDRIPDIRRIKPT
jgi:predicted nucleic acid-binding protein